MAILFFLAVAIYFIPLVIGFLDILWFIIGGLLSIVYGHHYPNNLIILILCLLHQASIMVAGVSSALVVL